MVDNPYPVAAPDYFELGWFPIPLPLNEKSPPPDGTTGASAEYVTEEQVLRWAGRSKLRGGFRGRPERAKAGNLSFPPGNIGVRMPKNVIGIDVDMYDEKSGAATIADAEERWGELPPTWVSTSRYDGSGIRFFRLPEASQGLKWPGQVGPGVETLLWYHRYAVVAPSIHNETRKKYTWIRPDGERVSDEVPAVSELPYLPAAWIEGLTSGVAWTSSGDDGGIEAPEAREWIEEHGAGDMCSAMEKTLRQYSAKVRSAGEDGGAHDAARDGAWALLGDAKLGHAGVSAALGKLRQTFLAAVKSRGRGRDGAAEWKRIVVKGVGKVRTELNGAEPGSDPCDLFANEGPVATPERARAGSEAFDFERDDIGNAERLQRRVGTDALWLPAYKSWSVYNPATSLWDLEEGDAAMTRHTMAMVREMDKEAAHIEDPDQAKQFKSWVKASGGTARISAAMELLRNMRGMSAPAESFDADRSVLHCSNGVYILEGEGAGSFRGRRHEDRATMTTPVPLLRNDQMLPKAKGEWDNFLRVVLPDRSDRDWVQTLIGYSILGANPERIMVFAKGPTSSGKTTFLETVRAALGGYAASFNLSLFRDKQDEGPRADIVEALPRRLLIASEASASWYLHADSIKRFTGGDPIKARRLNSNVQVERIPSFTPWLGTNSYPQVPGADKALWIRLKTAPFLISLEEDERDPALRGRLLRKDVLEVVLAWLVAGWERYAAEGLRGDSANALEMLVEARNEMSDLDMFLAEACETGTPGEYEVEARAIYDAYRSWCDLAGMPPNQILTLNAFGRALSAKGFERGVRNVDGKSVRVRQGLRLMGGWARA